MKRKIRLTESELISLIKKTIKEYTQTPETPIECLIRQFDLGTMIPQSCKKLENKNDQNLPNVKTCLKDLNVHLTLDNLKKVAECFGFKIPFI